MLVAAVAAVTTIDQKVYAFVTPIPTASVSTVATAGSKTMIVQRCASAAPTKKLTVESTSTFGLPYFNGFAAGKVLPNTLILREGASRYTTGFGIKIPILIPKNDPWPPHSGKIQAPVGIGISGGSLAGTLLWSTADAAVACHPKSASRLTSYRPTDR